MREIDVQREPEEDVIDLGKLFIDLWKGFKKFWWMILLLAVVGTVVACVYKKATYYPLYQADASFTVKVMGSSTGNEANTTYNFYYDKSTADQMGKTFPYILNSDALRDELKEALGKDVIDGSISASAISDSNLFTLTVTSANKESAIEILNAVIQVYQDVAQYVIGDTQLQILEEAELNETPINQPDYLKSAMYGAGAGCALGFLILLGYALSRKTICQPDDLKQVLNIECLAALPEQKKIQKKDGHESVSILAENTDYGFTESIWSLQHRIESIMKKQNQKVLMITSTAPSEGKSVVSLNLALAMAQRGKKVLLLDGDLRKSDLKERLHIQSELPSFRDILKGKVALDDAIHYLQDERIMFLGSGQTTSNPDQLIASRAMGRLMQKLRERADIIIVDTPPCAIMADASLLWEHVDGVLYVVRQDWANESKIIDAIQELPENGFKLMGCILNRVKTGFASYGYGKTGYGKYGYGHYGANRK